MRQRAGVQPVQAGINGRLVAGDHRALEVGVAPHADVEAAIAGLDPRLLGDTGSKKGTDLFFPSRRIEQKNKSVPLFACPLFAPGEVRL